MPQLVAVSGLKPAQLPSQPPPARIESSTAPEPPLCEIPPRRWALAMVAPFGSVNVPVPVHAFPLPGVPFPVKEVISFQAPEPSGGRPVAQLASMSPCCCAKLPRFWPAMATLASGDNSPNTGARNDVPHVPLMVKSSTGAQLNATFGLEVPFTSLYWS